MASMGLSKHEKQMVAVLLSGAVLVVLNLTLLTPAFPSIMKDFGVDPTTVQWLTSGYALVEAIVIPLSAWILGRFRTRLLFVTGMMVFLAGSILSIIAPIFPVLLLGRLLQAAATGIVMTMVMTLMILIFPRERRGAAMGLIGLVMGFAPAIGPSLGGVLVDTVGWKMNFVIIAVLTSIVIIGAVRFLTNFEGFKRSAFDVPSMIFSTLGLAPFLYGLSSLTSSENFTIPLAFMGVGLVFIALFARRQFKLETPLLRLEVLRSRRYRTAVIVLVALQATLIGSGVVMPLYIQDVLGYSATVSGLVMLPGTVCGAIVGLIAGRLFDRYGVRGLALIGGTLVAISGIGLSFYAIDSPILLVFAISTLFGVSLQLLFNPINTWGINSLDNSVIQHANAVTNTLNQVGGSFGTALIVSFSALGTAAAPEMDALGQAYMGYHFSLMAATGLTLIIFFVIVFFVRNKKGEETTPARIIEVKPESSPEAPRRAEISQAEAESASV